MVNTHQIAWSHVPDHGLCLSILFSSKTLIVPLMCFKNYILMFVGR